MEKLKVIFEDNHLLAVHKPAGIPTQGDESGDEPLVDMVENYIRLMYQKPGNVYVGLLHRLDRPTEGIVLFAKTSKAAARMSKMFQERKIKKTYMAITHGRPNPEEGRLFNYLWKDPKNNKVYCYDKEKTDSKAGELFYQLLEMDGNMSLIKVNPITGRPHQIRAQLSYIRCSIVGDTKYGSNLPLNDRSICLLCYEMEFDHPVKKGEIVTVRSATPETKFFDKFDFFKEKRKKGKWNGE